MNPLHDRSVRLPDSTLPLLLHGYAWLPDLLRAEGRPLVRTRLMGRPAVALHGPDAVPFFYDEDNIVRRAAVPGPVLDTLFGRGAVHTLDGEAHRVRKAMFTALLKDAGGVAALTDTVVEQWRAAVAAHRGEQVVLFEQASRVLARSVCAWAGLPLAEAHARRMAADCVAMVDGFATPGPRHLRARRARTRQERSLAALVAAVRRGDRQAAAASALAAVVEHRGADGQPLDERTAAVELLNVIRPTIAIAWFVVFAAHALNRQPGLSPALRDDDSGAHRVRFAHEVRRFYPFAPFVGGRAARNTSWRGEPVEAGCTVLLDVYGQHHDPALWGDPYAFRPDRFAGPQPPVDLILAQGGGDAARGHRCPGEDITVSVLAALSGELARCRLDVPAQDLSIPLSRIPTLPRSGFSARIALPSDPLVGTAAAR
ncbi:Fatty-acid peroxygenase [Streptomyces sp. enrichment culture]|uniref:cytochrome P450 n=1 Tax=Streptomyces sp. enrichment culture TaxID=1795815 RepID=UPI003F56DB0C